MQIIAANHSSYPKVGDRPEQQAHRQAYAQLEKGEISKEDFGKVQDQVVKEAIDEQVKAGLGLLTDGLIRWYDPISHFTRGLGCGVNGLLRFFDTNFYFRQPIVTGSVSWKEPTVVGEFVFAKKSSSGSIKAVVTGPYTLAKLSINRGGADFKTLVGEFAKAIAQEVKELSKNGAEIIQLEEPSILKNPGDFDVFRTAVETVVSEKENAEIDLYTYFGDAAPIYSKLMRLPVDGLGFDFTYSSRLTDVIARLGCSKNLGLGLVDGRNTKLESEEGVLKVLKRILPTVGSERVYLSTSCGVGDYLPREVAFKKLEMISTITKKAREIV
jgi:5-methyltetrahydropteroyltriglutamate--homocysteine methyltransferase